jgi:TraM recognition site of TraD and TraG
MIYRDLAIGRAASGDILMLDADARRRNLLMVGPPNTGKSSALEDQARQIITNDEGFFLLDGDGTLYDRLVTWCAEHRLHRRRSIHLIDLREEQWSVGLDALRVPPSPDKPYSPTMLDAVRIARIDGLVAGIEQIFGEDSRQTPRLRRCLPAACYALAVNELTLAEMGMLTTASDISGVRRALTANLPNQTFRDVWSDLNRLKPDAYQEQFESSVNRMTGVLAYPMTRRMLGQRRRALDFRQAMDRREVILCRAAAQENKGVSWHGARLVGTLLLTEMILAGLSRDEAAGYDRPFNVMIDEAAQFLTPVIEFALDRLRKRGVHFTFAIQRLGHLKDAGDGLYDAVMQDAQTKIIFRQNRDGEPTEELAMELFRPEFNLNQVKLTSPATTGHYIEILTSKSLSEGEGGAHIAAESEASSESQVGNWGHSVIDVTGDQMHWDGSMPAVLPDGLGRSHSIARGDVKGGSLAQARQSGRSAADVESWNRAVVESERQVMAPRIEWITTQLKPLPEVIHDHIVVLRDLNDREAIVKSMNRPTVRIRTLDVDPAFAIPRLLSKFTREVYEQSAYTSPLKAIDQEIAERHERLARMVGTSSTTGPDAPDGPELKDPVWG